MECPIAGCRGRMRKAWADRPNHLTPQEFRATGFHWKCGTCGVQRTQAEMEAG